MPDDKERINKAKAIDICVEELFIGKATGQIVSFFQEKYGVSRSAVEKWIRVAKPLVEERRQAAMQVQRKLDEQTLTDLAKKHGVTLDAIIAEYKKIAFADIRNVFDQDGALKKISEWDDSTAGAISAVETNEINVNGMKVGDTRKLKVWDKKGGLDGLCKIFGYTIPKDDDAPPTDLSALPITFK